MSKKISFITIVATFCIAWLYTYFKINPTFFEFVQQPAFMLDAEFFSNTARFPGGLGHYISLFFEQLFCYRLLASILMVAVVFASGYLSAQTIKKISNESILIQTVAWILPMLISAILWLDVRFAFSINIHLLLTLIALNCATSTSNSRWHLPINLIIAILVYHICGAMWLYTFTISVAIFELIKRKKESAIGACTIILLSIIYPIIIYTFFPFTPKQAFSDFTPELPIYIRYKPQWQSYLIFAHLPVIMIITALFKNTKPKPKIQYILFSLSILCIGFSAYQIGKKADNSTIRTRVAIQIAAYNSDWQQVIGLSKQCKQYDRYINFSYNMAIAKTNQMGNALFSYPQYLGTEGLFIDEPFAGEICLQSSYLYAHLGLINIALRFAYEAETTMPNSPYILRHIIDCLIIKNDYQLAEMYLKKLDKIFLQHSFVADRRAFIEGEANTQLKPEYVAQQRAKMPTMPFIYGQNFAKNLQQLISHNSSNRMAHDYLLATCLLNRRMAQFYQHLTENPFVDMKNLPKTYQEALLIYLTDPNNPNRDNIANNINPQLISNFKEFTKYVSHNRDAAYQTMAARFPNSYWLYYIYDNPSVTKASVKQIKK